MVHSPVRRRVLEGSLLCFKQWSFSPRPVMQRVAGQPRGQLGKLWPRCNSTEKGARKLKHLLPITNTSPFYLKNLYEELLYFGSKRRMVFCEKTIGPEVLECTIHNNFLTWWRQVAWRHRGVESQKLQRWTSIAPNANDSNSLRRINCC